jgi:hypothetical protein
VLPIWSAAIDPRVLAVRAVRDVGRSGLTFDANSCTRLLRGPSMEHLLIDRGGDLVRLDVIEGSVAGGPVALRFDLADDDRLDFRIAALRLFRGSPPARGHARLTGRLRALHAADMQDTGASLRDIADVLLGPGDWPGDGEHRKSQVRRLIVAGQDMKRRGARAILRME